MGRRHGTIASATREISAPSGGRRGLITTALLLPPGTYAPGGETIGRCASPRGHDHGVRRILTRQRAATGAEPGECASNLFEDRGDPGRVSAACTAVERRPGRRTGRLFGFARRASRAHKQTMPNRRLEPHGRSATALAWSHPSIWVAGRLAVRLAAGTPSPRNKRPSAGLEPQASGVVWTGPVVRAIWPARAGSSLLRRRRGGGRPSRVLLPCQRHQLRDHASLMAAASSGGRDAQELGGVRTTQVGPGPQC